MNFKENQIEDLISYLEGSCKTLSEGIQEILGDWLDPMDMSVKNLQQIDESIFLCEICGWWFEVAEMSEERVESVCLSCTRD